jgi:hypothetical protein
VTALIGVARTFDKHGSLQNSVVQTVDFRGDGASMLSQQFIAKSITSTGPLGDVSVQSGINNITASSIFGNISSSGAIFGTIQTTGQRTDPITGVRSQVAADFGRAYVVTATKNSPAYITATTVQGSGGGSLSGQIISRGDLISSMSGDGGVTAMIAAQGNIGANATIGTYSDRVGGILVNGGFSGQVIALGNILADMTFHGGLRGGGLAVKGNPIKGFNPSRIGILGNVVVDGIIDGSSAIVSGGEIGDPAFGTTLSYGNNKGIVAAKGSITFGSSTDPSKGYVFNNASAGQNAAAIDAIFETQSGALITSFDGATPLDLANLNLILTDLARLHVVKTSSGQYVLSDS